eukprot:TRINITY_DN4376_c0_g4_i1.p1 TRINITY_DN4376_c0_g4~~TRINITY_DN4376_c0_g4_i1.p1  ORF type:complete len:1996 (+),score=396.50 TRINITY_DN4376_c0_g4_i1:96-6083(+)
MATWYDDDDEYVLHLLPAPSQQRGVRTDHGRVTSQVDLRPGSTPDHTLHRQLNPAGQHSYATTHSSQDLGRVGLQQLLAPQPRAAPFQPRGTYPEARAAPASAPPPHASFIRLQPSQQTRQAHSQQVYSQQQLQPQQQQRREQPHQPSQGPVQHERQPQAMPQRRRQPQPAAAAVDEEPETRRPQSHQQRRDQTQRPQQHQVQPKLQGQPTQGQPTQGQQKQAPKPSGPQQRQREREHLLGVVVPGLEPGTGEVQPMGGGPRLRFSRPNSDESIEQFLGVDVQVSFVKQGGARCVITGIQSPVMNGTVKTLVVEKGYGFLSVPNAEDVYFRLDQLQSTIVARPGLKVVFVTVTDSRSQKLAARCVHLQEDASTDLETEKDVLQYLRSKVRDVPSLLIAMARPDEERMWHSVFRREYRVTAPTRECMNILMRIFASPDFAKTALKAQRVKLLAPVTETFLHDLDARFIQNMAQPSIEDLQAYLDAFANLLRLHSAQDQVTEAICSILTNMFSKRRVKKWNHLDADEVQDLCSEADRLLDTADVGFDSDSDDLIVTHRREVSSVPSCAELLAFPSYIGELAPNKVSARYADADEYLETHFHLLRAECFAPLAYGIANKLAETLDDRDMSVYTDVEVVAVSVNKFSGILAHKMSFKTKKVIKWDHCDLLKQGNLICVSCDDFRTVYFATVVLRDEELLQQGFVQLEFLPLHADRFMAQLRQCGHKAQMVESPTFYISFKSCLAAIRDMRHLPVDLEPTILRYKPSTVDDDSDCAIWNTVLDIQREDGIRFEKSQGRAVYHALRSNVALIQGPPGTGKTFVGRYIVRLLLQLMEQGIVEESPILLVTYKNLALDQFLEGLVEEVPDMIRIGSRCQSDVLQSKMLNRCSYKRSHASISQRNAFRDELSKVEQTLQTSPEGLEKLTLQTLVQCADVRHVRCILGRDPPAADAAVDVIDSCNASIWKWLFGKHVDLAAVDGTVSRVQPRVAATSTKPLPQVPVSRRAATGRHAVAGSADSDSENSDYEATVWREELAVSAQQRAIEAEADLTATMSMEFDVSPDFPIPYGTFNLKQMSMPDRMRLAQQWLYNLRQQFNEQRKQAMAQYERIAAQLSELETQSKVEALRTAPLIGMTTTGAAQNLDLLQVVCPRIVIVEEAAEILEGHLLACLHDEVTRLIMIGDHQQLQPSVDVHQLATQKHLNISMFERLVMNKVPHVTLHQQHRMKPAISTLTKFIYRNQPEPVDIVDHESACNRDLVLQDGQKCVHVPPPPMRSRVFWWCHEHPQDDAGTRSKLNRAEIEMGIALALQLVSQGVRASKITVLSPYVAQHMEARKQLLRHRELCDCVAVTVDRYQGEENDIVILLMTRSTSSSPKKPSVGFLSKQNRMCVALSRARLGLYIVGNVNYLWLDARARGVWQPVVEQLQQQKALSSELVLQCPRHPDSVLKCRTAADAKKTLCSQPCPFQYPCRHQCTLKCHGSAHDRCTMKCDHVLHCGLHRCAKSCHHGKPCTRCTAPCPKPLLCGHACQNQCSDQCTVSCLELVNVTLPCAHQMQVPCHQRNDSHVCNVPCNRKRPDCGHPCANVCGVDCMLGPCLGCAKVAQQQTEKARVEQQRRLRMLASQCDAQAQFAVVACDVRDVSVYMAPHLHISTQNRELTVQNVQHIVNEPLQQRFYQHCSDKLSDLLKPNVFLCVPCNRLQDAYAMAEFGIPKKSILRDLCAFADVDLSAQSQAFAVLCEVALGRVGSPQSGRADTTSVPDAHGLKLKVKSVNQVLPRYIITCGVSAVAKVARFQPTQLLTELQFGTDEYHRASNAFEARLCHRHPDYPEMAFEIVRIEYVHNPTVRTMFEDCKKALSVKTVQTVFHCTRAENIAAICTNGLLKVGHPKNPSTATDGGWFGNPRLGVYVATNPEYCFKYGNNHRPLQVGQQVRVLMFSAAPGRSYQFKKMVIGASVQHGYDSHTSPNQLELFLPLDGQLCPTHVVTVRAVKDDRMIVADDH